MLLILKKSSQPHWFPILHILCSVGFLNVVDSNLFGWKLRKHNPSSTLCVLIFVCFAFAGWGLFRDWWCGGGLVPFYETYEDKPRSCCSFLWESCERHHKFLFLPIFLSSSESFHCSLAIPTKCFSFDEYILLKKNKELLFREIAVTWHRQMCFYILF